MGRNNNCLLVDNRRYECIFTYAISLNPVDFIAQGHNNRSNFSVTVSFPGIMVCDYIFSSFICCIVNVSAKAYTCFFCICSKWTTLTYITWLLLTVCPANHYGPECKLTCGNCKEGTQCRQTDGFCLGGCTEEYTGNTCKESKCRRLSLKSQ